MAAKKAGVTALDLWVAILESIGKSKDEAESVLAGLAEKYPDLDSFHRAVQSYIAAELEPALARIPVVLLQQAIAWKQAGGKSVVVKTDSALG